MPKTVSVAVTVDADLQARFNAAAEAKNRDAGELIVELMQDYVDREAEEEGYDAFFRAKVEKARASIEAGRVISGSDVENEASAWRSQS